MRVAALATGGHADQLVEKAPDELAFTRQCLLNYQQRLKFPSVPLEALLDKDTGPQYINRNLGK